MASSWRKYETRKRDPNPQIAALLVIDMQNHFSSMAKPILNNALTTIELCRRASIPVFFTRHLHKSPTDHGMLGEWWNGDLLRIEFLIKSENESEGWRNLKNATWYQSMKDPWRGSEAWLKKTKRMRWSSSSLEGELSERVQRKPFISER